VTDRAPGSRAAPLPGRGGAPPSKPEPRPHQIPLWPGLVTAALVGLVYLLVGSGGTFRFRPSPYSHHVLVADAWLHGQLHVRQEIIDARNAEFYRNYRAALEGKVRAQGLQLTESQWEELKARLKPPSAHDLFVTDGKYYGVWGPMVPLLLLPYVALAGLQASDILIDNLFGMVDVFLVYLMLRQAHQAGFVRLTTAICVALALLLGLGTVHFYLAVLGQVWFLSQIVATCFSIMAIWFVLRSTRGTGWAVASGAALGAAYLSRSSVLLTAPFFYGAILAIQQPRDARSWRHAVRDAAAFSLPLIVAGAVSLAFNYARFGNAFDSGSNVLTGGNPRFRQEYLQYGLFSLHYLPRNLYYYFLNPTLRRLPGTGAVTFDPYGNSVFLVTPALLYAFGSLRPRNGLALSAWAGVATWMAALLLFQFTGWYAFGSRYTLDVMPLALLLVARGLNGRLSRVALVLIGLSVAVNAWGTYRCSLELL
jgi:hypothetical protein